MADPAFRVNGNSSLRVFFAGEERTAVALIDDFAEDTAPLIEHACSVAAFEPDTTSAYPGVRAKPTRDYVTETMNAVVPLLYRLYSVPQTMRARLKRAYYSLVATSPGELRTLQRIPHFDGSADYYFAATHYLAPGPFAGTGLFRHRPTGFENITAERLDDYIKAGDEYIRTHGDPPAAYINASNDHFELYESIDYRPNRIVIYPGSMLHSILIDSERDLSADPTNGRLTGNFFIEFQ